MAWFKKKEEQEIQEDIPTLPELPNPNKPIPLLTISKWASG